MLEVHQFFLIKLVAVQTSGAFPRDIDLKKNSCPVVASLRRRVRFKFFTPHRHAATGCFGNSKFTALIQNLSINGSAFR
jgi:hypothetical protein